jgi:hypothetical protein
MALTTTNLQGDWIMAITSIDDVTSLINQQIALQEKIETCLWKLDSMISVAVLSDDLYDLSEISLQNYFSVAADIIQKATKANQESLCALMKTSKY